MKSIFEIERRFSLKESYRRLIDLTDEKVFSRELSYIPVSLWVIVDDSIRKWKYRGNANNYREFLKDIGIDVYRGDVSETTMMHVMEFILNIVIFINDEINKNKNNEEHYINIIENITYTLEKINYQIIEKDGEYHFAKRDADVDSVLPLIQSDRKLAIALLEYNDFKIKDDANSKELIIFEIGKWMEPNKGKYSELNSTLTRRVFYLLNNVSIRHNNSGQTKIPESERIEFYDKLFKMMLHLIRTEEIVKLQSELKEL